MELQSLGRRTVVGNFNGRMGSAEGGGLLQVQIEAKTDILARLSEPFIDYRMADAIEYTVRERVGERVLGLALG